MSVPLQIVRSSPGVRNGGSLAVSHISLSPFAGEGDQDSGCQVLWEDGERVFCRGWRLGEDGSRGAVLVVLPVAAHPSPSSLDRLAHEHGLKEELDGAWAVRPLEIVRDAGRTMLVLEDVGGFEPLDRLLAAPMEVESFLRLAIGIAVAIGKLHESGLVHKDIKPVNILLNRTTGEVKLTGFGIASRLSREHQAPDPPETIAGTLAYMAPEQTGRMNRSIDSRSDLYALGVTFYRMLTGVLPFSAADPLEWVHCHIARNPTPPAERLRNCSGSSLRCRYEAHGQDGGGALPDSRRRRARSAALPRPVGSRAAHRPVSVGRARPARSPDDPREAVRDESARSRPCTPLSIALSRAAGRNWCWSRARPESASPRWCMSCTARWRRRAACSRPASSTNTSVTSPTPAWRKPCMDLIRPLLGKSEAELAPWRAALTAALGPNGALMVTLLPDLELLIGPQPPAPELPPRDAQRRFQLVFRRLLGVFARPEHPLALFLDDLQWLDAATLDLLEDLLTQRGSASPASNRRLSG